MNRERPIRHFAELLARSLIAATFVFALATMAPSWAFSATDAAERPSLTARRLAQQAVVPQVAKLLADDTPDDRFFGESVAVSNDTLVVGAYKDSTHGSLSGAAYVFVRNEGGGDEWNQVAKLTASDAAASAYFGYDVAISGDTIVVGAYGDDGSTGAAYVFERNEGSLDGWGEVQQLLATGGSTGDYFGEFVDISGDTIVVGAPMANSYAGTAYVFERNEGGADNWGQITELSPTTSADSDARFGWSVAISGDTIVVGAYYDGTYSPGSAYVFGRNQGGPDNWGEVAKITGSDTVDFDRFGYAVDIAVDTIVVGARDHDGEGSGAGAAYVFERNQGGADQWGQVEKLAADDAAENDQFGDSVAIDGESIVVGTPYVDQNGSNSGTLYLFTRNQNGADNWDQVKELIGGDTETGDCFGDGVAISGHTIVAGAPLNDGVGAAYVFARRGAQARHEQKRLGDDTAGGDLFGSAVAVSGDTLVVGAPYEDQYGDFSGAAYVLARNEGGETWWGQVTRLPIASSDHYELGSAVDIDGDLLVVGAPGGDRAHICERNAGGIDTWSIVCTVNGTPDTSFGQAVAISGDTVVVGAPGEEVGGHTGAGAAHVYVRNRGGSDAWGFLTTLDASTFAEDSDHFGDAVDISGDRIVVGAYYADPDGNSAAGAAYIFERNFGGVDTWAQARRLVADDADGGEWFGKSVALDNDTIIIGAPLETVSAYGDGAAYIFERNWGGCAGIWGQVEKVTAGSGSYFGWSVDLSFDVAVVGAYLDDSAASNAGAAYVFERNAGGADNWGQMDRITADDAVADDYFGKAVSISGNVIAVGAEYDDDAGSGSGAVYIYRWQEAQIFLPLILREV